MASVSVIIPVYNRKSVCQIALDRLINQTLPDIEFVIVDDGSTDGVYEYLLERTAFDSRFKILRNPHNMGPSAARNNAIPHTTGKYIGFFDIDDSIPVDYFDTLYRNAVANSADIVFCAYNNIRHYQTGMIPNDATKFSVLRNGALWDKLFLRDLIIANDIKFPTGLYCADNMFVFSVFYYAKRIFLCDTPVYSYTLSSDSISSDESKATKRKSDILTVSNKIIQFARSHNFDSAYTTETYHFINRTFNLYRNDSDFMSAFDEVLRHFVPEHTRRPTYNFRTSRILVLWIKLLGVLRVYNRQSRQLRLDMLRIWQSGLFDINWYINNHPNIKRCDAVRHYLTYGWKCGYNPSMAFDGDAYLRDNPDVMSGGMCPLLHYIVAGYKEGRYARLVFNIQEQG